MQSDAKKYCWVMLLSYLTLVGITIDLRIPNTDGSFFHQLGNAIKGFSMERTLLFAGLCALYAYMLGRVRKTTWTQRDRACVAVPAVLFAGFMVVGYSFAQTNSLHLIIENNAQMAKSLVAFTGYGVGFSISIAWFYTWLTGLKLLDNEELPQRRSLLGRYKNMLTKAPFRTTFLTLFIIYIPYIILSYPAIFMGDTDNMILQGFNFPEPNSNYLHLIDENVRLNGHHPIINTLFIHICLVIGRAVFRSYNIGIFLVALSQLLGVCAIVAGSIRIFVKIGVHKNILLGLIAYYAFAPRIQNYMFLITKDVFSACALLLFLLSVFRMIQGKMPEKKALIELGLFGTAVGLFRNDGKYIVLGSFVVLWLLIKEHRKTLLVSGVTAALCLGSFFHVLMPAFHITPTSRREALSVPFQQTARYFRDYPEEITEEEWEAISAVLNADSLGERYVPTKSDNVKGRFRETATNRDLVNYFRVWFQMGLKHPGVYVQATLNNYYNYFYPGTRLASQYPYSWSQQCMENTNKNENLKELGSWFYHPEALDGARKLYEKLRENFFELPVFSLLRSPAAYVWLLILLVFYLIKKKGYKALSLTIPLVLSVGVCFISPCNGEYFRYLYGVSVCLPIVFFQCLYLCKFSGEEGTQNG